LAAVLPCERVCPDPVAVRIREPGAAPQWGLVDLPVTVVVEAVADLVGEWPAATASVEDTFVDLAVAVIVEAVADLGRGGETRGVEIIAVAAHPRDSFLTLTCHHWAGIIAEPVPIEIRKVGSGLTRWRRGGVAAPWPQPRHHGERTDASLRPAVHGRHSWMQALR